MINSFKRARLLAGLTQTELAERLGISAAAVHQWESGKGMPNPKRLKDIAFALHTTVESLIDGRAV